MRTSRRTLDARGQILPIAVAILIVLTILVPAMVYYAQRDSIWSAKQASNTGAFHLAEAGIEKAYLFVSLSTSTWDILQLGTAQADYNFDKSYTDIAGGTYTVSVTSGPGAQQVTIISVGRDRLKREVRALKAVYSNSIFGNTAIYAGRGVQIGGQVTVEWGGVMSPYTIAANNLGHPQFWSASQILTKDTDPNPPNCDSPNCVQWHSFQANLPPPPTIDFDFYRSSAAINFTGNCPAGGTPAGSCYYASGAAAAADWKETTNGIVFFEGALTVKSPGMYHKGAMVVMGQMNLPNGAWGVGSATMTMPPDAWKQYGNDWAAYRAGYDTAAPATFPGLDNTSYTSPSVCAPASGCVSSKIAVNGFLYVGQNFNNGGGGGGNSDIYGVLYSVGSATQTANSPVTFYYNGNAANQIKATNVNLTRVSWQDTLVGWPASLP